MEVAVLKNMQRNEGSPVVQLGFLSRVMRITGRDIESEHKYRRHWRAVYILGLNEVKQTHTFYALNTQPLVLLAVPFDVLVIRTRASVQD